MRSKRETSALGHGSAGLVAARRADYERAVYRVDAEPRPFFLGVGERSPELDRWLNELGTVRCALLSAANPGSLPLPAGENELRHRRLVARVEEIGHRFLAGESFEAATGAWREPSLLVAGIDVESATALAGEFGQSALLVAEVGGAVRLISTRA